MKKNPIIKIIFITLTLIISAFLYYEINNKNHMSTFEENIILYNENELESIIRNGLIAGQEKIIFRDRHLKSEDIFEILLNVVNDEPEVLFFTDAEYKRGKLKINYSKHSSEIKKDQIKLRIKRDEIISEIIDDQMSDYEKVKAVHDYIVTNSAYDLNMLENGYYKEESYTAYGNLVLGIGVCEGYAKSMKYILDKLGIENQVIVGATKDHRHAWNLVKLDDEYYHIDLTWDDPITGECQGVLHYTYFNLSDDDISKTHFWNRDKYPDARGQYYNYFSYNDLVISNKDELVNKLKHALLNKYDKILLKYENYKEDRIIIDNIIDDLKIEYGKSIELESYDYCMDECQEVFNVYFKYYGNQ